MGRSDYERYSYPGKVTEKWRKTLQIPCVAPNGPTDKDEEIPHWDGPLCYEAG